MRTYLVSVLIIFGLALAACRSVPSTPEVTPELTPAPSMTPTLAPTSTSTPSPSPTPTKPTATPTATMTATSTPAPPTEDPGLASTQAVEALMAQGSPRVLQTHLSSDGLWRVEVLRYECRQVDEEGEKAFELLKLVEVATGEETIVDTQLQNCGGVGAFGLGFAFWSGNGQYLYYTSAREGVPDGLCGYWEPSLIQYGLVSEARMEISYGPLSPDYTRLAFSGGSWGTEMTLWDTNGGRLGRVPLVVPNGLVQGIAWAPDGKALAYLQVEEVCGPPGQSTIVQLDAETLRQEALITADSPGFREISWDSPDRIRLIDENGRRWTLTLSPVALVPN